jgi:cell division protein FtsX
LLGGKRGKKMAVDERSRHQLYQKLQEVLGAEDATTLMEHLPTGGVGQLATKDDLTATRNDLRAVREDLEHKIDAVKHELLTEIHRTARNLTLSLTTIMAVLNGIVFAALKLS